MIDLYGVLQEQEVIKGDIGLGVDYYKGETGAQGIPGKDGKDGKTPVKGVDYYTDEEIASIKEEIAKEVTVGAKGEDGKSAYQIAVDEGFEGSEADWLASLKGADGKDGINGTNGVDGKTPVKGVDYFTDAEIEAIEQGAADKVDTAGYAKSADLSTVATSGSYNDLADKPTIPSTVGLASTKYVDDKVAGIVIPEVPTKVSAFENDKGYLTEHQSLAEYAKKTEIPAPYTLPTASTSTLGGVKVDGSTITIADGVISAKGGSGGAEPDAYIKDASVNGNTLTLTKKDDTEIVFTPSGGGSTNASDIIFDNTDTGLSATNVQAALEEINTDLVGSEQVQEMIDENRAWNNVALINQMIPKVVPYGASIYSASTESEFFHNLRTYGSVAWYGMPDARPTYQHLYNEGYRMLLQTNNDNTITREISLSAFKDSTSVWESLFRNSSYVLVWGNSLIHFTNSAMKNLQTAFSKVYYNNTTSGLTATNIPAAIDELAAKINSLVDGNEVSY